jgi:hypothetical protein
MGIERCGSLGLCEVENKEAVKERKNLIIDFLNSQLVI